MEHETIGDHNQNLLEGTTESTTNKCTYSSHVTSNQSHYLTQVMWLIMVSQTSNTMGNWRVLTCDEEWPWVLPVLSPCHSCPLGNEAVQSTCSWYNSAANNSTVYKDSNWTRRTNFRVHNMGSFPTVYQLKTETIKPRQFIHSVLRCWQNTQQETFQWKRRESTSTNRIYVKAVRTRHHRHE